MKRALSQFPMSDQSFRLAAEMTLVGLEATCGLLPSGYNDCIFLPTLKVEASRDQSISFLEGLPKPIICLGVHLWGKLGIGVWSVDALTADLWDKQRRVAQLLVADLEANVHGSDAPIEVTRPNGDTVSGLAASVRTIDVWLSNYSVIGLGIGFDQHYDEGGLVCRPRLQLGLATNVRLSDAVWTRRLLGHGEK